MVVLRTRWLFVMANMLFYVMLTFISMDPTWPSQMMDITQNDRTTLLGVYVVFMAVFVAAIKLVRSLS